MHRLRYVGLEAAWQLKFVIVMRGLSACCYGYDSILDNKFTMISKDVCGSSGCHEAPHY